MTTPRIEEMTKSLGHKIEYIVSNRDEYPDTHQEVDKVIKEALTQAHQAGIDEAVYICWRYCGTDASDNLEDAIKRERVRKALQDNK